MTNQSRSPEPSTEAGRALNDYIAARNQGTSRLMRERVHKAILDIERQARQIGKQDCALNKHGIEAEAAAQALSAQPDEGLREAAKAALIELEARNPHDEACDIQPEFGYEHCICGLDDVILTLRSALAANEGPNEGRLMDEKDGLLAAALVASFVIDPNHTFHAKLSREAAADLRAALLRATEGEKP